jgi:plastocyanin
VTANGNGIYDTQDLAFRPASVNARVGQVVRWRNTDTIVPRTATEYHGLWNLAGTYGQTPANPPGFAPGTTVQRAFEAGTAHYYCMVHPTQMHGVVAVPVALSVSSATASAARRPSRRSRRPARRRVRARLRANDDPARATDWSPDASIQA